MKRSTAITFIRNLLYELPDDSEESATKLLIKLEELGMHPPSLPQEYCQAIMHIYYAGYTFNQWEEDIEKNEQVMKIVNERRRVSALTVEERRAELEARRKARKNGQ